jgi:hypothetical protein
MYSRVLFLNHNRFRIKDNIVLLAYPQMEERLIIKVQYNWVRPVIHNKEALTKMWIGEAK